MIYGANTKNYMGCWNQQQILLERMSDIMGNPLFNLLNGGKNNGTGNMIQQFQQFKKQMQGVDPQEEVQKLLQSGKISQEQLNKAQQMAQQMQGLFK